METKAYIAGTWQPCAWGGGEGAALHPLGMASLVGQPNFTARLCAASFGWWFCLIFIPLLYERCWTKQRIIARGFCRQPLKISVSGSSKYVRWRPSTIPWICAISTWRRSAWLLKSGVPLLTSILSSLLSGEALWVAALPLPSAAEQADWQLSASTAWINWFFPFVSLWNPSLWAVWISPPRGQFI